MTTEPNPAGIYIVKFYVNGTCKEITIDDYFPYDPKTRKPAFTQTQGNEIWVLILEKAWAKLNGSYENTISGLTNDALSFLLPSPSSVIDHCYPKYNEEQMWNMIDNWENKGHIVCGSSQTEDTKQDMSKVGIVSMHAYTISEIVEIHTSTEGKIKLVRMRNPWGHHEWDGEWSDKSSKWTPKLRKKLNYYEKDDGEFFISYPDYLTYYRTTSVTHFEPHYEISSIILKQAKSSFHHVEVSLKESTHFYFSVEQINPRLMKAPFKNIQPSPSRIIIGKVTEEQKSGNRKYEFIDACFSYDQILVWDSKTQLDIGCYVIFIEVEWSSDSQVHEYVASVYSDNEVKFGIRESTGLNHIFLEEVMKSCAKQRTEKYVYNDYKQPDIHRYMSIKDSQSDYGYVYYENNSKSAILEEKVHFNEMEGFTLLFPYKGDSISVTVQPGESTIALLKRVENKTKFACSFYTSIKENNLDLAKEAVSKGEKSNIEKGEYA